MLLLAIAALGLYSLIMAGWSSNSKYAFLGALRSVAQYICYEVSIGFAYIMVIADSRSCNLSLVVENQLVWSNFFLYPFIFFIYFISVLAELIEYLLICRKRSQNWYQDIM